jgi:hypothetical protein
MASGPCCSAARASRSATLAGFRPLHAHRVARVLADQCEHRQRVRLRPTGLAGDDDRLVLAPSGRLDDSDDADMVIGVAAPVRAPVEGAALGVGLGGGYGVHGPGSFPVKAPAGGLVSVSGPLNRTWIFAR